jgi:hypothetical protein
MEVKKIQYLKSYSKNKSLWGDLLPLRRRLGWGFSFFFFLSSCVEKVDWPLQSVSDNRIVVEGIFTDEYKQQKVTLTFPTEELNQGPTPVSGATLTINDGSTTYELTETDSGTGVYFSDFLKGEENKKYTLSISYNGKNHDAQTYLLPLSAIVPITYYSINDSEYYYDWKIDVYFTEDAMYEISFDWSHVTGYEDLEYDQNHFIGYTYSLKTIDVNEIFSAKKENVFFPLGTIIVIKKYSLTPEHAEYIRALLSETQWNGNIFSTAPANLPTNLSEGAIGFWGGCKVVADTIVVSQ